MTPSILANRSILLFFITWWLAWAVMQFFLLDHLGFDSQITITDSLLSSLSLGAICLFISNNMRYYLPQKEQYWYILIAGLAGSFLWLWIHRGITSIIFTDAGYLDLIRNTWQIRFVAGFILVSSMSVFSLLWYTQQEQKEIRTRKSEIEDLNKEAELFKLRQQLQPHFLFNSLNSISALTLSNPEKAREMVQQLSDFLRGTIRKEAQQWNTLSEELDHLSLYLEIEKVRFENRLQTHVDCPSAFNAWKLPSLLLQPLVENAIKFGLYGTLSEVTISVIVKEEQNQLRISVTNPYDPDSEQTAKGTGFGLKGIERRLFLLFARNDLLQTHKSDGFFTTTLFIPKA